ncbi:hypothetical protein [Ulvibacterium marinum]|uniref:hypothetical protein n=1 Tax=Ulvibacterium marinum TaxID=2419782 RepID=UPI002494B295|nr:hypothetical protein [Ulvibacterium marinum]
MLSGLFKYLKFLITSRNQHGVHSPFVYNFITRSIYTKTRYKGNKVLDVLLKSVDYFKAKVILLPKEDIALKDLIQKNSSKVAFQGKPYDIIYLEHPNEVSCHEYSPSENRIHNDSMLLINSIHKNKKMETHWENIKKWEHVTVTLDFFYCGAVFFRKEQAEEHFKIRI